MSWFHRFCEMKTKVATHVLDQELRVARDQILGLTTELLALKEDYRQERLRYDGELAQSRERERELMDRIILMAQPGAFMAMEREKAARVVRPEIGSGNGDDLTMPNVAGSPPAKPLRRPLVTPPDRVRTYPNRGPLAAINDRNQGTANEVEATTANTTTNDAATDLDAGLEVSGN